MWRLVLLKEWEGPHTWNIVDCLFDSEQSLVRNEHILAAGERVSELEIEQNDLQIVQDQFNVNQ